MNGRTLIVGGLAVVLLGGGAAYAVASRPRTVNYTTATAARGTITQVFTASGTVTRSGQSDLTFDAPGTVTALAVKVGDPVVKGQRLAQVDTATLQVGLLQAQAQLAQARAVLDADQVAHDNGGSAAGLPGGLTGSGASGGSTGGATSGTGGLTGSGSTGTGSTGTGSTGTGTAEQPAYLLALQKSLGQLQGVAAAQQTACAPVYAAIGTLQDLQSQLPMTLPTALPTHLPTTLPTPLPAELAPATAAAETSDPTPTTSDETPTTGRHAGKPSPTTTTSSPAPTTPAPTTTPPTSPAPTTTSPSAHPTLPVAEAKRLAEQLQTCATSMVALAGAEQEAGAAIATASAGMQAATQAAQQQLVAAQKQMIASAQAAAQQAAAEAMAQAQAQLAAQAQRAYGSTVTDATLASDRARVLQYEQSVAKAQRGLDGATLTSPVDGTVGAMSLTAGENSAGRSVTIVAPGTAEVSVEVPLAVRGLVSSGQPAQVGLVGADLDRSGQVSSVSVLATSSVGSPTYTATIAVADPAMGLFAGAKALVSVPLRTASDVVSVPLSAVVKTSDTTGNVQVVADAYAESAQTVPVTTGAFGGGRIEITSGLEPGRLVVLADRRLPVPGGLSQYGGPASSASPSATPSR